MAINRLTFLFHAAFNASFSVPLMESDYTASFERTATGIAYLMLTAQNPANTIYMQLML